MTYHNNLHSFHIPVMGLAYTIDTPIRLAHLGISSVLSLGDDILIERVRKFYSSKFNLSFTPIEADEDDARARRITAYLDMVQDIVQKKFELHKNRLIESASYMNSFREMLPDCSKVKKELEKVWLKYEMSDLKAWLNEHLRPGKIDVNIMTKLDNVNYKGAEPLAAKFNDGHASLRGFAESKISSSVVLSAGMNPRLYSYFENLKDFYPDKEGQLNKKIILKVSDYRSALVQGKFLAKKGIWVSEYRMESGLNCGGHAFATQGKLMGPILEEFKRNKDELIASVFSLYKTALEEKGFTVGEQAPELHITAQGGVGTSEEHNFLLQNYELSSVGWGSPFLLVPEAVSIDETTRNLLSEAKEEDFYLSQASPLGVPFNNIKGSSRQVEMMKSNVKGKTGSPCTKKFLKLNTEFTDKPICTASTKYHNLKLAQMEKAGLSKQQYQKEHNELMEKECLCGGLSTPFFLENDMDTKIEGAGVTVCPGPNLAYFSGKISLKEMISHIYGRLNLIDTGLRPHMFIKELELYVNYLFKELDMYKSEPNNKKVKYLKNFQVNLLEGIDYYKSLFLKKESFLSQGINSLIEQLNNFENKLKTNHVLQKMSVLA
ncbi:hypothetical protein JKA74_03115 [Marivirga sp. S37H4]|uniref:Uncharacterized protein n=1 Tax=Marivirga aurantiaca TaxID=2802615 RepID=A0A934WW57_9BACT|nr:hypothetical protein [Marivirga aurantiaca]MBK6264015.1 hypothetical protein [Marivirga aurantiaca]